MSSPSPRPSNPRVSVTLSPQLYAVLREMSELTGNSQSATIGELLQQAMPTFRRMVRLLRAASEAKATVGDVLAGDVSRAQLVIERHLGIEGQLDDSDLGQLDLLQAVDRIERRASRPPRSASASVAAAPAPGGPPRSNRGVRYPKQSKDQQDGGGSDAPL